MKKPDYCPKSVWDNTADTVICLICEKSNIPPQCAERIKQIANYQSELRDKSESMPADFAELLNEHFSELL